MCVCFVFRCVCVVASLFLFTVALYFVHYLSRDAVANAARRIQGPLVPVEDE